MYTRRLTCRVLSLVGALVLASALPARALTFTVNSTADEIDINPGDGVCETASLVCTLRAAVQEANAFPGADTIIVPAGTYTLTLVGARPVTASRR